MNQENYLKSLPDTARERFLQDNAAKVDEGKYMRTLCDEDVIAAKDRLCDNSIKLSDLTAEFDEVKDAFKAQIKPIKQENAQILTEIRGKQRVESGTLYHLPNHEEGIMETYNQDGDFITSRKLKPDERQGGLFQLGIAK